MPSRSGPPTVAGRWSITPDRETDPTRRAHAAAEALLDRHGVVTRGAVVSERTPGGFAAVYKVLVGLRGVWPLPARLLRRRVSAQRSSAPTGAVDRLRSMAADRESDGRDRRAGRRCVLAATDPANPFGAALPGPSGPRRGQRRPSARSQGRRDRRARRRRTSRCTSSAVAARC